MDVIVEEQEFTSSISPARFFKAYIIDSHNLLPKILPSVVKSIETIEGNGGPGSIKLITFYEGSQVRSMKYKIEELDETNHTYKSSVIEADNKGQEIESITTSIKIEAGPNGGLIYKSIATYHTKGDNQDAIQEKIKKAKDGATAFFKAVEAHLLSNPDEYK